MPIKDNMQRSRGLWSGMAFFAMASFAAQNTDAQTISTTVHDAYNLHPAWTLTELHPAGWIPQLMDMEYLPDGRLVVLTMKVERENTTGTPHKVDSLFIISNFGTG